MLFNSLEFAVFCPIVFLLYWFVFNKKLVVRNVFLILASYFFYGWCDWRFLGLIFGITLSSFLCGLCINNAITQGKEKKAKLFSLINIVICIGTLFFFKYLNFFISSICSVLTLFGSGISIESMKIVLPIGISFYVFQSLSYTLDVKRGIIEAERSPITFFAYISFFPQLLAGPIGRAPHLLPQYRELRQFDSRKASDGMKQFLWGWFKKAVVADNCAILVNSVYSNYSEQSSTMLLLGAIFYTVQIYCDFSGYSDMAIGTAKLFNIDFSNNFNYPYFAKDMREFWRRWHISLTKWFTDYVYIPLGGSRCSKIRIVLNTMIVYLISGLWHGANWTFVFWGFYHGILFIPLIFYGKKQQTSSLIVSERLSLSSGLRMCVVFVLATVGWVFFRSNTIGEAFGYLGGFFTHSFFPLCNKTLLLKCGVFSVILFLTEWLQRDKKHGLQIDHKGIFKHKFFRYLLYYIILICILSFTGESQSFIYFQF